MRFCVADPDERYAAVRLRCDLPLSDTARSFARDGGEWVLEIEPPPIDRLEYQLELVLADGGDGDRVCDPGNPLRAPGAFGEKSVAAGAGLRAARVARRRGVDGRFAEIAPRGAASARTSPRGSGRPADAPPEHPLPLLVAHDGPEYDALCRPHAATPRR